VITGVAFTTDKPQYDFFDADRRQLQQALEARLPDLRVAVTGMSRDERRMIVRTFSDKSLGACYLYDHAVWLLPPHGGLPGPAPGQSGGEPAAGLTAGRRAQRVSFSSCTSGGGAEEVLPLWLIMGVRVQ
jgi:hypothetical protein